MPHYGRLMKARSPKAWSQYRAMRRCLDSANVMRRTEHDGHFIATEVLVCLSDLVDSQDEKKNALLQPYKALASIVRAMSDYSDAFTLEFSPRNLAVDDDGNLVLLDVMFDAELLNSMRGMG